MADVDLAAILVPVLVPLSASLGLALREAIAGVRRHRGVVRRLDLLTVRVARLEGGKRRRRRANGEDRDDDDDEPRCSCEE